MVINLSPSWSLYSELLVSYMPFGIGHNAEDINVAVQPSTTPPIPTLDMIV